MFSKKLKKINPLINNNLNEIRICPICDGCGYEGDNVCDYCDGKGHISTFFRKDYEGLPLSD